MPRGNPCDPFLFAFTIAIKGRRMDEKGKTEPTIFLILYLSSYQKKHPCSLWMPGNIWQQFPYVHQNPQKSNPNPKVTMKKMCINRIIMSAAGTLLVASFN